MASNFSQVKSLQLRNSIEEELLIEGLSSRGLAQLRIMGLPDSWLRECKDKIQSIAAAIGGWESLDRVLIHILPEEEDKVGAHLELPIALSCLIVLSREELPESSLNYLKTHYFIGALGLDAKLRSTPSIEALYQNSEKPIVGPRSYASLQELWADFKNGELRSQKNSETTPLDYEIPEIPTEGRTFEKQWLMIAAAARLPVLLTGLPGAGKSHLARWAHSLCPLFHVGHSRILKASLPLEAPHSKVPLQHYLGLSHRGSTRPGIFAKAHQGLLILDEFPELNRDVREILRTVLDKKEISQHQAGRLSHWPADFWLIATMNPCPCGFAKPLDISRCRCRNSHMELYAQKVSGPIFERFGMKLFIDLESSPEKARDDVPSSYAELKNKMPLPPAQEARKLEILMEIKKLFPKLSYREQKNKASLCEAFERLSQKDFQSFIPTLTSLVNQEARLLRFRSVTFRD